MPDRESEMTSIALQEWKAEWMAEAKADDLLRLLSRRFGTVPEGRRLEIVQASVSTLDQWFDRAIDAPDLDSVFRAPQVGPAER